MTSLQIACDGCQVSAKSMWLRRALLFATLAALALSCAHRARAQIVPYFPTPPALVDRMLALAEVKESDFLIDLGCGDGRIPIAAAQRYGTRGLGVDIQPQVLADAEENARKADVADKVVFKQQDLFDTDLSKATVLALYLSLKLNIALRPRILKTMKPGARVISHNFVMGDWLPDWTEQVEGHMLYLWIVPATVKGSWQLSYSGPEGAKSVPLKLEQQFQELRGSAVIDGKAVPVHDAKVSGERVSFAVDTGNGRPLRFEGRLLDGRLEGDGWTATRR